MTLVKNESLDVALCQECGGRCCTGSPGLWVDPERFFAIFFKEQRLTVKQLRQQLDELGLVLWEKSGVPMPAPQSLVTGCAFHGDNGCRFTLAERPCQCLALVPIKETLDQKQGSLCKLPDEFSKEVAMQHWQSYWQSLHLNN